MVQLVHITELKKTKQVKFQFHYGSISSKYCESKYNISREFQFHYGSISSIRRLCRGYC